MDKNIHYEFNKSFEGQINEELVYIRKTEFIDYFKTIINKLKNNNICFTVESNTKEDDYQYTGFLNDISLNDSEIRLSGDFNSSDNDSSCLLSIPLEKPEEELGVKIIFNPLPWLGFTLKQELPQTTNIIFEEKIFSKNYEYYKEYQLTFYFNLKEMLANLINTKNISRKIVFPMETDTINFFSNIKEYLIGKTFCYWIGKDVSTPILDVEIITKEDENILKITTEYGIEDIHTEYVQDIEENDNSLTFNQRPWNGSMYKIIL